MPTKQSLLLLGGRGYRRACSLIAGGVSTFAVVWLLVLATACSRQNAQGQIALSPGDAVPAGTALLPIWGQDREAQYDTVVCYIPVPESASVAEKIRGVCSRLSQLMFQYTGIELMRIDTVDGLSVAEINLVGDSTGYPWRGRYFEGSSGGRFTTVTLRESFLQRTYTGQWVDGVRFHLNNKPIEGVWDHVLLSGIFYRKDARPTMYLPPQK